MIPLVCSDHEIECLTPIIRDTAAKTCESCGCTVDYQIGCMLEVPRAMLRAEAIVKEDGVSFVSIGSNDLTQLMYGFSRDDCGTFMPQYIEKRIYAHDPFVSIDKKGVGAIIRMATENIRKSNPQAKVIPRF